MVCTIIKQNPIETQNLQNLWQNVEYRNFPITALDYITADTSICADARMCWIRLFKDAFFYDEWTIQISKNELKEKLNRSYGSIGRYLTDLEEKGYITIENVRVNGVWLPSKITITVPDELRVLLENCPTRKKGTKTSLKLVVNNSTKKDSDKLHVEHESTKKERTNIEHERVHKKEGGMIISDLSKSNNKYNIYTNNKGDLDRSKRENKKSVVDLKNIKNQLSGSDTKIEPIIKDDFVPDTTQEKKILNLDNELKPLKEKFKSIPAIQKASFYKNHIFAIEHELLQIKHDIDSDRLNYLKNKGYDVFNLKTQRKQYLASKLELLRCVSSGLLASLADGDNVNDEIKVINSRICDVEAELKKLVDAEKISSCIQSLGYLHKAGKRQLTSEEIDWLKTSINEIVGDNTEKIDIISNEIAYQVRFGNLQVSYQTGKTMTVKHGVNIALKKLRTGEWSRPTGMLRAA